MQWAYGEFNQLIKEGYGFELALSMVKARYGLKSTFQIELWYHNSIHAIERGDETIEALAYQLQQSNELDQKPTLWEKLTSWIA